ncbi:MAG TPA: phosphohydrolase, partial [Actinoplanes sp.]
MAPRMLLSMPLHAITEVYGEAGLRNRFQMELESFPPAERVQLVLAFDLAARLHAEDRRVREPYLNHQ